MSVSRNQTPQSDDSKRDDQKRTPLNGELNVPDEPLELAQLLLPQIYLPSANPPSMGMAQISSEHEQLTLEVVFKVLFNEIENQIQVFDTAAAKASFSFKSHSAERIAEHFEDLVSNELRDNAITPELIGAMLRGFPITEQSYSRYVELESLLTTLFAIIPRFTNPYDASTIQPHLPIATFFNTLRSLGRLRKELDLFDKASQQYDSESPRYFIPDEARGAAEKLLLSSQALDGIEFMPLPSSSTLRVLEFESVGGTLDAKAPEMKAVEAWASETLARVESYRSRLSKVSSHSHRFGKEIERVSIADRKRHHDLIHFSEHLGKTLYAVLTFYSHDPTSSFRTMQWAKEVQRLPLELKELVDTIRERLTLPLNGFTTQDK